MTKRKVTLIVIILSLVWGLLNVAGQTVFGGHQLTLSSSLDGPSAGSIGQWAVQWLLRGVAVALILRLTNSKMPVRYMIYLTLGWVICGLAHWWLRWPLAGALVIVILRRVKTRLRWLDALILGGTWTLAPLAVHFMVRPLASLLIMPVVSGVEGLLIGGVLGAVLGWRLLGMDWGQIEKRPEPAFWSARRMTRKLEDNPIYRRLLKLSVERSLYTLIGTTLGLGVLVLLISMSLWKTWRQVTGVSGPQATVIPFLIYMITLAPTIRVPVVVSAIAAILTATDAEKQQFELIRLTPLTHREIVWAYTVAPLQLTRGLLTFEYIVMLLMLVAAICGFLPSFPNTENEIIIGMFFAVPLIALGLLATNLLASAIGVRVALWSRDPTMAVVVAPLVMLMIILLVTSVVFYNLQALTEHFSIEILINFFLFTTITYLVATELMDTMKPWVTPAPGQDANIAQVSQV